MKSLKKNVNSKPNLKANSKNKKWLTRSLLSVTCASLAFGGLSVGVWQGTTNKKDTTSLNDVIDSAAKTQKQQPLTKESVTQAKSYIEEAADNAKKNAILDDKTYQEFKQSSEKYLEAYNNNTFTLEDLSKMANDNGFTYSKQQAFLNGDTDLSSVTLSNVAQSQQAYADANLNFTAKIYGVTKGVTSTATLDTYLNNLFLGMSDKDYASYLGGKFGNVYFNYVPLSQGGKTSFDDMTFNLKAKPKANFMWSDGNTNEVNITVKITNYQRVNSAALPTSDVLTTEIMPGEVTDNQSLAKKLETMLPTTFDDTQKYDNNYQNLGLQNEASYKNVKIALVTNTVNFANETFQIKVKPNDGYAWSDGTYAEKTITVKATILKKTDFISEVDFTYEIKGLYDPGLSSDAELDTYLSNLFNENGGVAGMQKYFSQSLANYDAKYVGLAQDPDAVNLSISSFLIHVTPKAGFVWDDNTKSEKVIRVVITNFTTDQKMGKVSDSLEKVRTTAIVMASLGAAAAAIAAAYWGLAIWSFGISSPAAVAATAQSVVLFAQSAAFGTLYELNKNTPEYNEIKDLDVIYTSDNLQFGFLVTKSVVYLTQVVKWINILYKPFVAMKTGVYLLDLGIISTSWAVPVGLAILTSLTIILSFLDVILSIPGIVV